MALAHDAMTGIEAGSERAPGMVQRTPDIEVEPLFEDPMYVAMAAAHRLSESGPLLPDMVARAVREDIVIRPLEPSPPPRPIGADLPAGYRSAAAA